MIAAAAPAVPKKPPPLLVLHHGVGGGGGAGVDMEDCHSYLYYMVFLFQSCPSLPTYELAANPPVARRICSFLHPIVVVVRLVGDDKFYYRVISTTAGV